MVDCGPDGDTNIFVISFDDTLTPLRKFTRLPSKHTYKLIFRAPCYANTKYGEKLVVISDCPGVERTSLVLDPSGVYYECRLNLAASGTWKVMLISSTTSPDDTHLGTYIQIPPKLSLRDTLLPLESIRLISVVSKWLGDFSEWPKFVEEFRKTGYNMVHFTPLQQRGMSNSPYSIKDHLSLSPELSLKEVRSFVKSSCESGVLSMIDIVWNHIACDSPHLKAHPDIGYTLENSPHLRVAYDLDDGILAFSSAIEGYAIHSEDDLEALMKRFAEEFLPKLQLWEYFVINVGKHVLELENFIQSKVCRIDPGSGRRRIDPQSDYARIATGVKTDGLHGRFSTFINMAVVYEVYHDQIAEIIGAPNELERSVRLSRLLASFRSVLDAINYERYRGYDERIVKIIRNLTSRVRYERLDSNGPLLGPISRDHPMVSTYFTRVWLADGRLHAFANNGWIWNADPLSNFAEEPSEAYFLRDVIIWGDCVKLRYGQKAEDSPWLWAYMETYTREMASMFHAFRIDNCHSTPIHVAEHLIGVARKVNPELYVCAELFTGSSDRDMQFVTRLGLNSLIREAMAAWSAGDLGRNLAEYGGQPLGSTRCSPEYQQGTSLDVNGVKSSPHALFADCTHDNETPAQRRTAVDALPNSAAVAMSLCAMGSVLGYDILVPAHINIVNDSRKFSPDNLRTAGIAPVKMMLHELHAKMQDEGYTEILANETDQVLTVIRENPATRESYFLLSYHAFSWDRPARDTVLEFLGTHMQIVFSARLSICSPDSPDCKCNGSPRREGYISGTPCRVAIKKGELLDGLGWIAMTEDAEGRSVTKLHLEQFHPGTIIAMHRKPDVHLSSILTLLDDVGNLKNGLREATKDFNLVDLNWALYRCDQEEHDSDYPGGVYDVPGFGKLPYCGIAGFYQVVMHILSANELSHPLCNNIREGNWMIDYIINRVSHYSGLSLYSEWLKRSFGRVKELPGYLQPKYFCKLVELTFSELKRHALHLMSMEKSSPFTQDLAMGSVQCIGRVRSTGLHPSEDLGPSMAAGLPHFTTHHMRVWGRDVFLSFKGLFLLTGRFEEAKQHLVAFAGCLYNGLIPNLLDCGRRPRYNSRDATWYFLEALQGYYKMATDGPAIMEVSVPMRFPDGLYIDFDDPSIYTEALPMSEIVHRILSSHAARISFTEWNAGEGLDNVMRLEGFLVEAGIDPESGFVYGGNEWNCGTWMDKMGESRLAGNSGVPATPRDGCAIELTALLASACKWLENLEGWSGRVYVLKNGSSKNLAAIHDMIKASFEERFFVPGKRSYYKDTVGASNPSCDLQLRPNYLSAMVFAPHLFKPEHSRAALATADQTLKGVLGMRTLAEDDSSYRPVYSHADSEDYATAKGFNYHQGPEWVWCYGHFLLAELKFCPQHVSVDCLREHMKHLAGSPFLGLPELTCGEGQYCPESCRTQAWSMATLLEVMIELDK